MRVIPEDDRYFDYRQLRLTDAERSFSFSWPEHPGSGQPIIFLPGQTYRFRIARPDPLHYGPRIRPTLLSIQHDEQEVADYELCPVHQVKMVYASLEIGYGFPAPAMQPEPDEATYEAFFPRREKMVLGGCVTRRGEFVPERFPMHVCPECNQAYARWQEAHQPKP